MLRNSLRAALLAVMVVVFVTANTHAQTNASVAVNASAKVMGNLSISKVADVAFGDISATTAGAVALDPKGATSAYVGSAAAAGEVQVTCDAGASVRLTWPTSITLSDGASTPDLLTYTLNVYGYDGNGGQSSSSQLSLSSGYTSVSPTGTTYTLWIGGSLGKLTSQVTGTYNSTNTGGSSASFTVEYN